MQKHIITLLCAASLAISAPALAASKSNALKIKPNAPTRYVVKQGDTLWSIAGQYLYRPYKWPQLWNVNKRSIRNPHLIYPGQVLHLTWVNGRPVLRASAGAGSVGGIPKVKLHPQMRDLGSGYGIPTLNVNFYRMFMKQPQFMTDTQLKVAPRIVSGPESRVLYGNSDRVYADGPVEDGEYLIFRVVRSLKDPITGKDLGNLVEFAGQAYTIATNDTAYQNRDEQLPTLTDRQRKHLQNDEYFVKNGTKMVKVRSASPLIIGDTISEIRQGDYLIRKDEVMPAFNIMPHEPDAPITAKIVSVMDGVSQAGFGQTLILNKGEADGLNAGTVLSIYKNGRVVKSAWQSPTEKAAEYVNIPSEEMGLAMIYRTGENVSSAIILESMGNVDIGDTLREPGRDVDTFDEAQPSESMISDNTNFEPLTSGDLPAIFKPKSSK
ncbi:LysM peptidoglycan-binding domain-containing protein [Alysiella filiformis]|uniref:LysM domain-containing protein n=1 Tax=Alysiella filiformis DSM 16848 TaxID=1120981 RepID=A0A286E773_9NEIS|nr:LysM domain-containing protein [Alysiella filiformis]QMT31585.1 LysM peptidoglycan-binding domain-containing protein [Alysiella filiformis]UBQ55403.1 LysM peptidoglycan-binding domain-containing protein [Alysiella filiformis DSM 16848]SOD66768.1 LysM domain-containing protein [Alysiella filiformis DSM 16848]